MDYSAEFVDEDKDKLYIGIVMKRYQQLLLGGAMMAITTMASVQAEGEANTGVKSSDSIKAEARAQAQKITIKQIKIMETTGEKFILIDIRTEDEYDAAHIEGSVWIPRGQLEFKIQKLTEDPKAKLVVACRTGSRSALAMLTLKELGYQNVFSLQGGFVAWVEADYSVFNRHGELKVVDYGKEEKVTVEAP